MIGWIFICCWATYLTAYLCRVNFSSAMSALSLEKGLMAEKLGVIGAVYYAVYACGQLVNGYIGDRVQANRFILLAISGTMLCNVGMAFTDTFAPMLLLWGVNGCFQSMFWSTIIRVLAQNIPADKRATISAGISLAMPVAYIVSWGLLGRCLDGAAVKWYFLIPALVCIPLAGAWLILSGKLSFETPENAGGKHTIAETVRFLGGEIRVVAVGFQALVLWLELEDEQRPREQQRNDEQRIQPIGCAPAEILDNRREQRRPHEGADADESGSDAEDLAAMLPTEPVSDQGRHGERPDAGQAQSKEDAPAPKPFHAIPKREHEQGKRQQDHR